MRRLLPYAGVVLLLSALAACDEGIVVDVGGFEVDGNGTVVEETRDVADFDRITLAGEGRVLVSEAQAGSLAIETDENLLVHIETAVRNGTLEIATEAGIDLDPTQSITYRVASPEITGLTLAGAGRIELGECDTETFSIALTGAGDIEIGSLAADVLEVDITGAGSVQLAGAVRSQAVSIPGAGSYDGHRLQSERASVTTSGVGSASVWVTEQLNATVSGVGDIDYFGSPRVTQTVSGVGSVNARGDA